MPPKPRKIRIATCQFAGTFRPMRNAAVVRRYIALAKRNRADVVHFHECALSGYGGAVGSKDYDWDVLREASESVLLTAKQRKIWVVLGTSHRLTGSHKPHNSLYLISPAGKIVDRYDKRFCTDRDLETYTPGDHFVTFRLNGIKCAMLICYDSRFPELYRELYTQGVRVVFHSFHNARAPARGILSYVMVPTIQSHAGINHMWISAPNCSGYYQLWASVFVTPDGKIAGKLPQHRAGLMVNTVDTGKKYYDPSAPFRDAAIQGVLHSGRLVRDPRSTDRKCY